MNKIDLESIDYALSKIRKQDLTTDVVVKGLKETIKHVLDEAVKSIVQSQYDTGNNRIVRATSPIMLHSVVDEVITFCLTTWVSLELDLTFDEIDSLPIVKRWMTRFIDQQLTECPIGMYTVHQLASSVAGLERFDDDQAVWQIQNKLASPIPTIITHMGWGVDRIKGEWILFKETAGAWLALQKEQA